MPPPHSFWVILIGKTPTSFRAKAREDLVPTLRQLQRTQSDVTLRWFERGKVWESPEAAIGAAKLAETAAREKRTREWRPGGEHRDPKARFELTRDQKRAKFKRERTDPQSPFGPRPPRGERPEGQTRPRPDRPWSDRSKPAPRPNRPWSDRPKFDRPKFDRPAGRERPVGPPMENPFKDRPRGENRPGPRGNSTPGPRPDRRPDVRPSGRSDRRPGSGRPPGRPSSNRGGFKPPKRRS